MYDVKKVSAQIGDAVVGIETGKLAKQADGAVVISVGDTEILVTAVASPKLREGIDFFPLTVDIEERMYSVGRIPGSWFRKEGRASEQGTLIARLTDRPIRPSFPDWFRHDVQIIGTVFQIDSIRPFDVNMITGASCALMLGGVPFAGPIAGVRAAHVGGEWIINPSYEDMEEATIELVVGGRANPDGSVDILMIEAGGFERTIELIDGGAPKPDEKLLAEGLEAVKEPLRQLCQMQRDLVAQTTVPERKWIEVTEYGDDVMARVKELTQSKLETALSVVAKSDRNDQLDAIKAELKETLATEFEDREKEISNAFRAIQKKILRGRIVNEGIRVDGRRTDEIRQLHAEVGLLSRAHGTGLFQRGETQALSITTLDMPRMEQTLDTIYPEETKRYMHHYYFPPFSTGEAYPMRGPSRRAIGHGALAEKAVLPVVPPPSEFPYAIRVVSEVLESNGSTSMASTCASCLSLMDAGVPLKGIIGGIAMGSVEEGDKRVTLTDIIGAEDNYGDMDFKVAGTEDFITALQLDTKTTGIPIDFLVSALDQAKVARLQVIDAMKKALDAPRTDMSDFAPRIDVVEIPADKIGEVIGPKGKMINSITERTGAQIDISDDGRVFVAGLRENVDAAKQLIKDVAFPRQVAIGDEFDGTVVNVREFGAFVNVVPGKDGLVHISKLSPKGQRVDKADDVVKVGDIMRVKVTEIRADGKLNLEPVFGDENGSSSNGSDSGGDSDN